MIITNFPFSVQEMGWCLLPRTSYVISDGMYHRILRQLEEDGIPTVSLGYSSLNNYRRNFCGQDLNGKTLAIYRESGRGDHLIITALCGWIKKTWPDSTIELYGAEETGEVWLYNKEVTYLGAPPTKQGYLSADYHFALEGLMEADSERDQPNCYDALYNIAGFDPKTIPDEWKRPRIFMGKADEVFASGWAENWKKQLGARPYALVHWNPSSTNRMYPPALYEQAIRRIAEKLDVVIVGNSNPLIDGPAIKHPRVHNYFNGTQRWRQLFPMIANASAVLCPDSSVAHAAACWPDVPVVGLWGPFSPDDRVKYYRNHHAINGASLCPHAPCRKQFSELPRHLCRDAQGYTDAERWCRALAGLDPEVIAEKVIDLANGRH